MKFFEWIKNLFTRKDKKLLLNAGNEDIDNIEEKLQEKDELRAVDAILEIQEDKQEEISEEEKRKQRLASPYFSYKFTVLDGIANRQFQGVDLSTGEILRLEKTDKIAETANGMNIYEGFVEHISNEKDMAIFEKDKKSGYPVIFESAIKLEDIASNKNPEQIHSVLDLLSKNKDVKLLKDQLIYIGGIRHDGKVYRQDCSSEESAEKITQKMIQYRW